VGGALAVAGSAYQSVLRNPLADPYLLGSASGAGLGATIAIIYSGGGPWLIPLAFLGAIGGVLLAIAIGSLADPYRRGTTTLLAGVALASFLTALQTYLQQRHAESLQRIYSWILGQLNTSGWDEVRSIIVPLALGLLVLIALARQLDVLALGDDKAASLGVHPTRSRVLVLVGASLATAAAVSAAGLVGFVGLMVPHLVRRFTPFGHRAALPAVFCAGAAFLVFADLVARTVIAPAEVPVGVVTAFVGSPALVMVLRSGSRR
jgi:iron complex transport system permease protein